MNVGYPAYLHKDKTTAGTYVASGDIVQVFVSGDFILQIVAQIGNDILGIHFRVSKNGGTNWGTWYGLKTS